MTTRRITFRLYPTRQQEAKLYEWRRLHTYLYNACIAHRREIYRQEKRTVGYFEQQNLLPEFKQVWPEFAELGSHALQATIKRVDFAYQRFFKGIGGFPKFKSIRRYSGWTYPCKSGWKALTDGKHGRLKLTNLGAIKMRGKARQWGTPTTCTIVLRAGKWYASITVNAQVERETGAGAIGLDFGCTTAIATSSGEKVAPPKFGRTAKVMTLQKQLRRKTKFSRRWKQIQKQVRAEHRRIAQRRQNWIHQQAAEIVSSNSLVASEKLELSKMTRKGKARKRQKAGLNRSLLDVGIASLASAIQVKLEEADGVWVTVPTRQVKPSQTCPSCGKQERKPLSQREHRCECGCVEDRDVAAAKVMLEWALGTNVLSRGGESSTPTHCGGFAQLASVRRHQTRCSVAAGSS
ncbi:MAG: transposase [Cyanobacteria bacterium J06639_1]